MSVIDSLVYDRTQSHVDRLLQLRDKGWANMTADEKGEYLYGEATPMEDSDGAQFTDLSGNALDCRDGVQRGAYNAADLNRVAEAAKYIRDRLTAEAGVSITVTAKDDWCRADIPTVAQMEAYIADVATVRGSLAVYSTTPAAPGSMVNFTAAKANAIEKILTDIDNLITSTAYAYRHQAVACGMTGGLIL